MWGYLHINLCICLYMYPYIYTCVQYLKHNMKTNTKYKKITMLWLNSGNIFMVSCWEGNTISGVLGTYLLLSLRGLYQAPKWFNRSGGPTVTGHIRKFRRWGYSSLGCWLLSSEAATPKSWQELLSFSQHGVFCSRWLGDYIWGKVWVERHYFIGLTSRSITQLRTQAFSVWLKSVVFLTMKRGVICSPERFCLTALVIPYEHHQITILILLFKFFSHIWPHIHIYRICIHSQTVRF